MEKGEVKEWEKFTEDERVLIAWAVSWCILGGSEEQLLGVPEKVVRLIVKMAGRMSELEERLSVQ